MKQSEGAVFDILPLQPQIRLTRTQRKILDTRNAIYFQPQPESDDLTFSARELVQATLPHQTPRGNPPVWSRTNGNYTLRIRPGYKTDPKTKKDVCIGYPYGNVPRLLLFWLTTEAVRTGSRRLELGGSLAGFMRELGMDPDRGGRWSDRARLHDQTERLFNASISFEYTGQVWFVSYHGFTAAFGDMTLWNSLAFCVLLPYISSYSCVTTLIRWGHGRSVAPETASMAEGARFRLNTSHHRPDPLVT